jgi:murein DD-endopeptidase MepM/ murein hydrolase activator NlpD
MKQLAFLIGFAAMAIVPSRSWAQASWAWPADGKAGSYDRMRMGIDIAGKSGQPVLAAADGTVTLSYNSGFYGNLVVVKHTNALTSYYAHNKTNLVTHGQAVTKGQPIAEMGDTGLHFEVHQDGNPVDPTRFLPPRKADLAAEEAVSWAWPADGKAGPYDEMRRGIDIAGKSGQPIMAAANGTVTYVGGDMRGYGNMVIVKHTNSLLSAYAHNKTNLVKVGQTVGKGQPIAEMGDSDADGVKLHFEVRQNGKPIDPTKFLPPR